jgi:hypothetical protein
VLADHPGYIPLRLKAVSTDDLTLVSACLQDMMLPLSALHYHEGVFMGLGNRFYWEGASRFEEWGHYYRVHSSFKIEHVTNVYKKGFEDKEKFLNLLLVTFHDHAIHLLFSDHKELKLEVSAIAVTVRDVNDPWITETKPDHGA